MTIRKKTSSRPESGAPTNPLLSDLGEQGLLERLARFTKGKDPRLVVGFGDDTAVWDSKERGRKAGGPLLLATTDTMVEGTHFRLEWASWNEVGRKLVASNVSDIASMGGRPTLALVSLACPPSTPMKSIESVYAGIRKECDRWGATLAGGDSVRSDKVVLTLMLLGEKPRASAPALRSGLQPGQRIYVTGWPGESGAGLDLLLREGPAARKSLPWKRRLINRHLLPTPRLRAGCELARRFPDLAMIDVSDGIDNELGLLSRASGMELEIDLDALPASPALRRLKNAHPRENPLGFVLFGGEDYELLFATAASPAAVAKALVAADPKLPVHEIGRVVAARKGGRVNYRNAAGKRVNPPSRPRFEHFSKR